MKKLAPLFILIFVMVGFAQTPCDLTLKGSPTVQQLSLGMDEKDVSKIYPIIKPNGVIPPGEYFKGKDVRMMHVEFYKGKLSGFTIFYRQNAEWLDAPEFTKAISEPLGLPVSSWRLLGSTESSYLPCKEFTVSASIKSSKNGGPMLIFADLLARKAKLADEKQAEENKKKAFKP